MGGNLTVGTHHNPFVPLCGNDPSDHRVCLFAEPGINYSHPAAHGGGFNATSVFPSVEYHGDLVPLFPAIAHKEIDEQASLSLKVPVMDSDKVIAVYNDEGNSSASLYPSE